MRREQNDVFCAVVPEGIVPDVADLKIIGLLQGLAEEWVWRQWTPRYKGPLEIDLTVSDWLITSDPDKVQEFQPAHDCEECREGNAKAEAFLKANPGRWLAMCNLTYVETWPDAPARPAGR